MSYDRSLMRLVIFDIDGTLTNTTKIDADHYLKALSQTFGIDDISTDWKDYENVTDAGITREIVQSKEGRPPRDEELNEFLERFVDLLSAAATRFPGAIQAVPGSAEALTRLRTEPGFAVAIASGSFRATAKIKLERAGVDIEGLPCAFSDDDQSRAGIVETAIARARRIYETEEFDSIVYVGDAPWDVVTSRKLGIAFIGVAKGRRAEALREEGAVWVIPDFSDYDAFLACLGAARFLG